LVRKVNLGILTSLRRDATVILKKRLSCVNYSACFIIMNNLCRGILKERLRGLSGMWVGWLEKADSGQMDV